MEGLRWDGTGGIPTFPTFASTEQVERCAFDAAVGQHQHYAEYSYLNMRAWDTKYRGVAVLNGNLVLRFFDADEGTTYLSFLGTRAVPETAAELLAAAAALGAAPRLRVVPGVVVEGNGRMQRQFRVAEDRDTDYVLSLLAWRTLDGPIFADIRYLVGRCLRLHNLDFRMIDPDDRAHRQEMVRLMELRASQKGVAGDPAIDEEADALGRLLAVATKARLVTSALFDGRCLVAFSIDEVLGNGYGLGHFWKADTSYDGVYQYMQYRLSEVLLGRGCTFHNIGQDLGIPALAAAKRALRPCAMLKKYTISPGPGTDHLVGAWHPTVPDPSMLVSVA